MADPEVLCLGESMVLLSPRAGQRLATAQEMALGVAGAESTVAQYLADLGHRAAWLSRVGSGPLGDQVLAAVAEPGVDVSYVERDPSAPTAVYFKDPAPEGTLVYYYRAGSAASRLTPRYLDGLPIASARLVHQSGITPALSAGCAETATALFERARAAGVSCSFDVNYRPALWRAEDAADPLLSLARQANVVFAGLDEARHVWGTDTAQAVRDLIGSSITVVVKNADVGATVFEPGVSRGTFVPAPRVDVVEPVGAGDAFAAGYLSAWLRGAEAAERLLLGHRTAAFALGSVSDHADATSLRRTEEPTT
ncbi:sugar kinase [Amycolatopsis taiwanensis]|uniref:Sugar kinase n=1 Tax=Amycolatopsis taiwanensis TaxID=342230 RepID=A0A9W6R539_9PSEU|nr:sugar kinase [Amycolatopsis taiwanensis]GLY68803.1 sugar kinase [Amycolatopsis taiwanensis]